MRINLLPSAGLLDALLLACACVAGCCALVTERQAPSSDADLLAAATAAALSPDAH